MTSAKLIPVYRLHQRALQSPCLLGEPCDVCRAHAPCREGHPCRPCRRGKDPECQRAVAAKPAFSIMFTQAMALVRAGLAEFILRQTALRLKFSQVAYLRDQSLRIDEALVMAYAQGDKRARAIIDDEIAGWCVQPTTVTVAAAVMMSRAERVIYFD